MASTSCVGRPRTRSAHLPTEIPVAFKADRPRTKSVYKVKVKGNSKKKLSNKLRLRSIIRSRFPQFANSKSTRRPSS